MADYLMFGSIHKHPSEINNGSDPRQPVLFGTSFKAHDDDDALRITGITGNAFLDHHRSPLGDFWCTNVETKKIQKIEVTASW